MLTITGTDHELDALDNGTLYQIRRPITHFLQEHKKPMPVGSHILLFDKRNGAFTRFRVTTAIAQRINMATLTDQIAEGFKSVDMRLEMLHHFAQNFGPYHPMDWTWVLGITEPVAHKGHDWPRYVADPNSGLVTIKKEAPGFISEDQA